MQSDDKRKMCDNAEAALMGERYGDLGSLFELVAKQKCDTTTDILKDLIEFLKKAM